MKIAACLFKYSPYSGLARDFLKVVKKLINKGHSVTIFTQKWEGKVEEELTIETIKCNALTNHGKAIEFNNAMKEIFNKEEFNCIIGFNKMEGLDFYYAADVSFVDYIESKKVKVVKWLYKKTKRYQYYSYLESAVFSGRTTVLFLDKSQLAKYNRIYKLNRNKFKILPPGIDTSFHYKNIDQYKLNEYRNNFNIESSRIILLQVGSDFKRKGVDRSIFALASLPKEILRYVELRVVGKDKEGFCRKLAKRLGVEENVYFIGPSDEVAMEMGIADIFLHPAYVENTGNVILEALVMGLPIIVTKNCGFSHHVAEANAGVVLSEPYSQDNYNDSLLKLIKNKKIRDQYVNNAKRYADSKDLFSMADVFVDIVEKKDIR